MVKTSFVLVNWNGREDIEACLNSLAAQSRDAGECETILLDNGSTDGSLELVEARYPWVRTLRRSENNYAAALNQGVREAKGDQIAFINVDARLEPSWLVVLRDTLERNTRCGVATGKIYLQAPRLFSVGMRQTEDLHWEPIGHGETDTGQYDGVYRVEFVSHCACLYRRRCIEEAGCLDEDFAMYHEDVDMSIRAREAGWGLMVNTGAVAHHALHGSVKQAIHLFNYFTDRNRMYVIGKHYPARFPDLFAHSCFYRYKYEDDSNRALQRDLAVMFDKWLRARDNSNVLGGELALIIRTLKERTYDPVEHLTMALELKTAGIVKSVVRLEMEYERLREDLERLRERIGRTRPQ